MKDYSTTWEPLLNAYDAKSVQIVCTAGHEVSVREKKSLIFIHRLLSMSQFQK